VRLVGAEFGEAIAMTLFIASILLNPMWTSSIPISSPQNNHMIDLDEFAHG